MTQSIYNNRAVIVVPTYNEVLNIEKLLDSIYAQQPKISTHDISVLVVDDKSPDGTAAIVRKLQKKYPQTYLLLGNKNGLGAAYVRGFQYVIKELKSDAIIMMDADLSHDPNIIPEMLNRISDGADYVIGSRYVRGGAIPGNWPILRIINSRVANSLARFLLASKQEIADTTGGFKAMRTSSLKKIDLVNLNAAGYVFQVSLLHAFVQTGSIITETPINFADREFGNSKLGVKDIIEFVYRVLLLNRNSPLHVAARFALVGLSGTLLNIAVLSILTNYFRMSPAYAILFAIELSIISNFLLNKTYTFKHLNPNDRGTSSNVYKDINSASREKKTFLLYQIGALSVAVFSYITYILLYKVVGLNYLLADIICIALGFIISFTYSSKFVWKAQNA